MADFGLSKRIEAVSDSKSKLFGVVPYIDPKSFSQQQNNNNKYSLNEKSDVYSVGVLLWEISSGRPPFYSEGESYDFDLILEINCLNARMPTSTIFSLFSSQTFL